MVTRFAPFNEPEFEYMESYLEDMARQGLLLDNYGIVNAYFYEGKPRRRRYRIVPRIMRRLNDEEINLYEEFGWHYIGKKWGTGLNILYTDDPDVPELFTDMYSFRSYAKYYAIVGLFCILCMLELLFDPFNTLGDAVQDMGIIHSIDEMGILVVVAIVLLLLLLVAVVEAFIVMEFSVAYRILRARPMRRNLNYKGKLKFHKVTTIVVVVLAVTLIIGSNFIGYDTTNITKMKAYEGYHPVSYEVVDPEGWGEIEKAITNNDWPENITFGVFTKTGPLFDRKIDVHTDLRNDYMRALYAEAKSEGIARKWLDEEIMYDTEDKLESEDIAMETPEGLDYMGYYIDKWNDQIIYMRKGNVIERIKYYGDKEILQYIDEFAADIADTE